MEVWTKSRIGPTTHAFIVGIGEYPHCGDNAVVQGASMIKSISSPAHSAYLVAGSVIENAEKFQAKLGSVTLLSENLGTNDWSPTLPTFKNLRTQFRQWQSKGKRGDCLLMYWCSHGLQHNGDQLLVCRDAGKDGDFWQLVTNITTDFYKAYVSEPKTQLWFIDACRDAAEDLRLFSPSASNFLPDTGLSAIGNASGKDLGMVLASGPFDQAQGLVDKPSFFSRALVDALKWAAWNRMQNDWQIRTTDFVQPINMLLAEREYDGRCRPFDGVGQHPILASEIGPDIPSKFRCEPISAQPEVKLALLDLARNRRFSQQNATNSTWELDVPGGYYFLKGEHVADPTTKEASVWILPNVREGVLPW